MHRLRRADPGRPPRPHAAHGRPRHPASSYKLIIFISIMAPADYLGFVVYIIHSDSTKFVHIIFVGLTVVRCKEFVSVMIDELLYINVCFAWLTVKRTGRAVQAGVVE